MRLKRIFFLSSGGILFFTAVAKLTSAMGHGSILGSNDPVTGLTFHNLFLIVAGIEAAVGYVCFFCKQLWLKAGLVAWLATNLAIYRFSLWEVGWRKPCACLGTLTDAIHVSPQLADGFMKVVVAYLLIGSFGILIHRWWTKRKLSIGL